MSRILSALLAVVAVAATGSCSVFSAEPMVVQAQFKNSVGLYEGNNVAVLGINVGTVTDIRPQGTHVVATLEIEPDTKMPADVVAAMVSPSVVTDRHIELTPPYKSGPALRDGDVIPIDRTRTPVEIDRVIEVADRLATELAKTDKNGKGLVKDSFEVAARNLKGNGGKIRSSIESLSTAIGAITEDRDALTGLIRNVEALTRAAARNDKTIRSFTTNLTGATELFAENSPEFGRLMKRVTSLLDQTDQLLSDNRSTIKALISRARVTTKTLTENTEVLAESVDLLPLVFQNLVRIVDPEKGIARVHLNLDDVLLDPKLLGIVCGRLGVQLPGCDSGGLDRYGADLGVTELLLGEVK